MQSTLTCSQQVTCLYRKEPHKLTLSLTSTSRTASEVAYKSPSVISNNSTKRKLGSCNIEEAGGRLLLHAFHAALSGHQSITIRTVDTDVVVLAIALFSKLNCP